MELLIKRNKYEAKQVLGTLTVLDNEGCVIYTGNTLELADNNNQQKINCIPKNTYTVVKRTSAKFKHHFHILDVPNRSYILIHAGNFHTDILGCVLVGSGYSDLNKDGYLDILNSKVALKKLLELLPDKFTLTIK